MAATAAFPRAQVDAADSAITKPPLSYSLPAFRPDGYECAPEWLAALRDLGFRWVTLHPTYPVYAGSPLRIDTSWAPAVAETVAAARELGLAVRLEPHLDWIHSLTGGPYEWRKSMSIDPAEAYFDQVLAPCSALRPDELTLGSELDLSLEEFTDSWASVADRLRNTASLGHKVNHDLEIGRALRRYLDSLDYRAVSFYPPERWKLPHGWTIGEFGLGSTDTRRPWHFDASTFQTPEDFAVRREWYLRFLRWLPGSHTTGAAALWTAGHFDVLGIMHPEWRDEAIVDAVRSYNYASP